MDDTSLLEPIAGDAASGPDLEYDPAFLTLERTIELAYADRAVGPESDESSPEWRPIAEQALALLGRTRDLRIAVTLTKAWLNLRGVHGLARGLSLLHGLVEQHWPGVHPRLGLDGDDTGIMRVNALRSLCDSRSVIAPLRSSPLVSAPGLGSFCLRDLEKVQGGTQSGNGAVDAASMEAVWIGCKLDALEVTAQAVEAARSDVAALEGLFSQHGGASLRLSELAVPLDAIHALLAPRLIAKRADDAASAMPAANGGGSNGHAVVNDLPLMAADRRAGDDAIRSRADIGRALDRICAYYDQHEPSSPVPILLRRAKRLSTMQFVDIVRELAPGGMAEIDTLRGPITTEES
ncbi:MAG TPA: type VI secretion system protein TssA [Polyangiales bacterium]|nr:type VI secretion system protein TssA [Polyangiales bacterium]